jgi:hypothetical protein
MRGFAARLTKLVLPAVLALAVTASSGSAAVQPRAPITGIVPHAGSTPATSSEDVYLHSMPCLVSVIPCWVLHSNTTYAIYWIPPGYSVDSHYETDINRYLSDVAAASGSQTNVYSVPTQYYDATGYIGNQSRFGGSVVDQDPFPASDCSDGSANHCLTDQQLQTEIQKEIAAKGWQPGQDAIFFIMTPEDVVSCTDGTSSDCSTTPKTGFCAYHSDFVVNGQPVLYANEPYDAKIDGCDSKESPNADDADDTINTISHEQIETISDPWGDAWLNADGEEIADICAWNFGTQPLGGTAGAEYNQVINGDHYWLQQIWSNDGSTCRLSYIGNPANTTLPALSGVAVQGKRLAVTKGSWTQVPTGYTYQWLRCKGTVCTTIAGATQATYVPRAADTGHTLEARVSAANSRATTAAVSKRSRPVIGVPATQRTPLVAGSARVGGRLSASKGSWSGPPKTYRFQWLRCNAGGGSCVHIGRATHPRYRLTLRDAGHRLRVRVTAVNVAGSKTVTSKATGLVPATG